MLFAQWNIIHNGILEMLPLDICCTQLLVYCACAALISPTVENSANTMMFLLFMQEMRFTWMNPEVIIFEPFTKLLPRRYTIVLRIDIQFTIKKEDCKVKSLLFKFDCTSLAGALSFNFYSSHIAARISLRKKLRTNINVRVHTDFCTRVASPRLHWFSRTNIHNPLISTIHIEFAQKPNSFKRSISLYSNLNVQYPTSGIQ